MRIGIVSTHYLPVTGGAETYIKNLIKVLESKGHEVSVYQFNNGESGPRIHLIPHKPKILFGKKRLELFWFNLVLLTKVKDLAKEDVLIVNYAIHSFPLWWHPRVIVLSHGCEWEIPTKSFSQKLKREVTKLSFHYFKYLVSNDSNYFRQMGVDLKPKEKMFQEILPGKWFLPNAVDEKIFKPTKAYPEIKNLNTILVPRNVSRARGIHLAIEAFALFRRKFSKTTLVVVGHLEFAPAEYRQHIKYLIKKLKLSNSVKFLGSIPGNRMPSVFSAAQMTVIPTLQSEGTSLAALESMACGIATVSTNRWGLADLPTVQTDANPVSLASSMETVYLNRKKVAESQRRIVSEQFNIKIWGDSWIRVIEQVVK